MEVLDTFLREAQLSGTETSHSNAQPSSGPFPFGNSLCEAEFWSKTRVNEPDKP